ncbi:hypothetical protein [Phenylobacterium sp.]|uniref:hypothetical protein n=1 Tax=Phenylobacterium sp. TaxID=1871053 RepID=UPI0025E6C1BC|nr:hypothetical protein [Phenylobacterium sp.]
MAKIRDRFCAWVYGPTGPGPQDIPSVTAIGALFGRRVGGDDPTADEWDRAAWAARAARAARAAWAAADWAAWAAWADWAAWAAAARAAWAAADWAAAGLAALLGDRIAIAKLDTKLARRLTAKCPKFRLAMDAWHSCKTTHCRAGWYITYGGKLGAELEEHFGAWLAGASIWLASHPGETSVPNFFASNEDALASICESAKREVSP